MRIIPILLGLAALPISCKDRDESLVTEFLKRPVSGMVGGEEWEAQYAYIDPTAKTLKPDDFAYIFLNYKPKKRCPKAESIPADAITAIVSAPKSKSRRPLKLKSGTARSMVLQWQKNEKPFALVTKTGRLQVLATSADKVKVKVQSRYNADNWVNGYFTADVCEYRDMTDFSEDVFQ